MNAEASRLGEGGGGWWDRETRYGVEPNGATWTRSGSGAHFRWIQDLWSWQTFKFLILAIKLYRSLKLLSLFSLQVSLHETLSTSPLPTYRCAGALINRIWVLTSVDCVDYVLDTVRLIPHNFKSAVKNHSNELPGTLSFVCSKQISQQSI